MPAFKRKNVGKKDTWYCKFYYKGDDENKKQKKKEGFATKKEALEYERNFIDKVNADSDMLFKSLIENYYKSIQYKLKPTTIETKKHMIDKKILPFFGEMKLCDIETKHVERWQNQLMSKSYSETYLKTISNQLSAIFNYAISNHNHTSNPQRKVGSMGKKYAGKVQFYTQEEFKLFLTAFEDDPELTMIFNLMFYTGIRQGEMLALTPADFDFKEMTMDINKNLQRFDGELIIQKPKTEGSTRNLTLPKHLADMMQDYFSKIHGLKKKDRIFLVSKSHLGMSMTRGAERTGLKRIKFHALRHSHASHLIHLKFTIEEVAERMGHDRIETTMRTYLHLYPNRDKAIAERLNECF